MPFASATSYCVSSTGARREALKDHRKESEELNVTYVAFRDLFLIEELRHGNREFRHWTRYTTIAMMEDDIERLLVDHGSSRRIDVKMGRILQVDQLHVVDFHVRSPNHRLNTETFGSLERLILTDDDLEATV